MSLRHTKAILTFTVVKEWHISHTRSDFRILYLSYLYLNTLGRDKNTSYLSIHFWLCPSWLYSTGQLESDNKWDEWEVGWHAATGYRLVLNTGSLQRGWSSWARLIKQTHRNCLCPNQFLQQSNILIHYWAIQTSKRKPMKFHNHHYSLQNLNVKFWSFQQIW